MYDTSLAVYTTKLWAKKVDLGGLVEGHHSSSGMTPDV